MVQTLETIPQEPAMDAYDAFAARMADPKTKARLQVQTEALHAIHQFLHAEGFTQLLPVMLSPITDPLNHPVHEAAVAPYGQELQITKSMILHKQAALMATDRPIYVMSPNVRLEMGDCASSGRHLYEFTQVDLEIPLADKHAFMDVMERMVVHVIKTVKDTCADALTVLGRTLTVPQAPFARHESKTLETLGDDWETQTSLATDQPFWVYDLEREFYDKEDTERSGYYHNYDLVWPEGFGEALSGAERDFEYDVLLRKILERDQKEADFASYMQLAKRGMLKPSAGGGLGIERLVRFLTGATHIADATLFPRVPGDEVLI